MENLWGTPWNEIYKNTKELKDAKVNDALSTVQKEIVKDLNEVVERDETFKIKENK